jgi:3-(3-hydroxy-phenyl)propionate hydroxylase
MLAPDMVKHLMETHEAAPESRIVRTAVYTFHARLAERWSEGRVYLAGDAAHLTPPFAGQGMNSGVRDACNIAWKLAAVTQKRLGSGLLKSYEPERRDHVWAMIEFALNIGRVLSPANKLTAFAIEWGFRALTLYPKARDYIAQMKFKPPPRFAKGFIVPDASSARETLVGRMLPQPRVRADGRDVLLDEVLGPGFALLVNSPRAETVVPLLQGKPWSDLGARIVVMGGRASAGALAVQALSPVPRFDAYNDHVLLLRPDRYVAACIPVSDLDKSATAVGKLIAETF